MSRRFSSAALIAASGRPAADRPLSRTVPAIGSVALLMEFNQGTPRVFHERVTARR